MQITFHRYKTPTETVKSLKEFVLNDRYGQPDYEHDISISKSNWIQSARNKENDDKFRSVFESVFWRGYCEWLKDTFEVQYPILQNLWYQVYDSNDYHDWHIHANTSIANVIYLQLQDHSLVTQFKLSDGSIHVPDVNEGDTLVFNPTYSHRSPSNQTNTKKIILSFNVVIS